MCLEGEVVLCGSGRHPKDWLVVVTSTGEGGADLN